MTVLLFTIAAVCLAVSGVVARRRRAPGARWMVVLLIAVAEWNVAYGMEILVEGLSAKLLWAKASYLGIVVAPVGILGFAADYSGRGAWLTPLRVACLSVIPLATLVLVWTHEAHHLVWSEIGDRTSSGVPLLLEHGPGFYPGWLYAYLLMFAASVLLLSVASFQQPYFRRQSVAVAVAIVAPWAANLAYVLGLTPGGLDFTTIAFAITALALALACLRWGLLDIAPVARAALVEHMRDGMVVLDAQDRIVDCNAAVRPLLACAPGAAIGRPVREVLPLGLTAVGEITVGGPASGPLEVIEVPGDAHPRVFEVEAVRLPARAGQSGRLLLFHDVTDRERLHARLEHQALTDDLTRIANRRCFLDSIRRALIEASRSGKRLAVVYLDLDDFKRVNDEYGHACGDAVLVATARRLEQCIRPGDAVARLGGDEFAILLPEVDDATDAAAVADRITSSMREPFAIDGEAHVVPASVGLHVAEPSGATPESLLTAADREMYEVKRASRRTDEGAPASRAPATRD